MDFLLAWDPAQQRADLAVANGDLALDAGLATAVVISLGTDRRAADSDALPDPRDAARAPGEADRRGWWGDAPLPDQAVPGALGSRLWLLRRSQATPQTQRIAESYAREALAWLVQDGVAQSVNVTSRLVGERLELGIVIRRGTAGAPWQGVWAVAIGAAT